MFGSGSGSQRLKVALGVVLGVVTVGALVALSGLGDNAGSAKTWLIASLVIAWTAGVFALVTSGSDGGGSLHAATEAAEALARTERRWGDAVGVGGAVATVVQVLTAGLVGWFALAEGDAIDGVWVPVLGLAALAVIDSAVPLVDAALRFVDARGAAVRVAELLRAPQERRPPRRPLPGSTPRIALSDVTVRYPGEDGAALDGVDLVLEPGRRIAVVGASGAGKSTLLGLVPRFFDVSRGRVLIDGVDVREFELDLLRRNVGLVFQESLLFRATIAENIAFGEPHAGRVRVEEAARVAGADGFVQKLAGAYDHVLDEAGANLSGGQRQRLAIARAMIRACRPRPW